MKNSLNQRKFKARETALVSPRPITITDRTAAALVGLEPRAFRELIVRKKIPHARIGDRVVVLVSDFEKFIASASTPENAEAEAAVDVESPMNADEILSRLGRRRAGSAR